MSLGLVSEDNCSLEGVAAGKDPEVDVVDVVEAPVEALGALRACHGLQGLTG